MCVLTLQEVVHLGAGKGVGVPSEPEERRLSLDAAAFERTYRDCARPIHRYLVHLVGPGAAAEDLFQETWLRAVERIDQLHDPSRIGPWLYRIARNLALNHLRERRRKTQVWAVSDLIADDAGGLDEIGGDRMGSDCNPRQEAIIEERRRILLELMSELDAETQSMLQLRYFENLKLAEIAEALDAPLGTVCTKIHRALAVIRAKMEKRGHHGVQAL
jgi:RNA polymerase sigma-70 factor (ECF subfamily)